MQIWETIPKASLVWVVFMGTGYGAGGGVGKRGMAGGMGGCPTAPSAFPPLRAAWVPANPQERRMGGGNDESGAVWATNEIAVWVWGCGTEPLKMW